MNLSELIDIIRTEQNINILEKWFKRSTKIKNDILSNEINNRLIYLESTK